MFNQSRAISTTRTVFRLNTNQSHAYENPRYKNLGNIPRVIYRKTKLIAHTFFRRLTSS